MDLKRSLHISRSDGHPCKVAIIHQAQCLLLRRESCISDHLSCLSRSFHFLRCVAQLVVSDCGDHSHVPGVLPVSHVCNIELVSLVKHQVSVIHVHSIRHTLLIGDVIHLFDVGHTQDRRHQVGASLAVKEVSQSTYIRQCGRPRQATHIGPLSSKFRQQSWVYYRDICLIVQQDLVPGQFADCGVYTTVHNTWLVWIPTTHTHSHNCWRLRQILII